LNIKIEVQVSDEGAIFAGCVNVVGCVKCEELVCWEELPKGVSIFYFSLGFELIIE
jgi:hypothetical protein